MRIRSGVAVLAVAVALAGCTKGGGGGPTSKPPPTRVGVAIPSTQSPLWAAFKAYVVQHAPAANLDVEFAEAEDAGQRAVAISKLASSGVKGMVIATNDRVTAAPTLADLKTAKMPVVAVGGRVEIGDASVVVRVDNISSAERACAVLGTKMGGAGSVAVAADASQDGNARGRRDAFATCMKRDHPGIELVDVTLRTAPAAARHDFAKAITDAAVTGAYVQGDFATTALTAALTDRGRAVPAGSAGHVWAVAHEGSPAQLREVRSGLLDAAVSEPIAVAAEWSLAYLKSAIAHRPVDEGVTEHESVVREVGGGMVEDILRPTVVTKTGEKVGELATTAVDEPTLWGNRR